MRALELRVGRERYALELAQVREVIRSPSIVRVPSRAAHVRGVFNLRGELIAALDSARLLGRREDLGARVCGEDGGAWWIVLHGAGEGGALCARECPRRVQLGPAAGEGETVGIASRHLDEDGEAIALIDLSRLLGGGSTG